MLVWLLASSSLSPLQTKNSSHTMPAYMWWTKSNFGIPLKALWSRISSLWTWMWLCPCAKKPCSLQKRLNLPASIPLHVVTMWQMAAEGHSDKMTSNVEVHMKQRCVIEFLRVGKMAPTDIPWCLLNIYEDQTVNECSEAVSVVFQQWW